MDAGLLKAVADQGIGAIAIVVIGGIFIMAIKAHMKAMEESRKDKKDDNEKWRQTIEKLSEKSDKQAERSIESIEYLARSINRRNDNDGL